MTSFSLLHSLSLLPISPFFLLSISICYFLLSPSKKERKKTSNEGGRKRKEGRKVGGKEKKKERKKNYGGVLGGWVEKGGENRCQWLGLMVQDKTTFPPVLSLLPITGVIASVPGMVTKKEVVICSSAGVFLALN